MLARVTKLDLVPVGEKKNLTLKKQKKSVNFSE